jgi:hypothetical protein
MSVIGFEVNEVGFSVAFIGDVSKGDVVGKMLLTNPLMFSTTTAAETVDAVLVVFEDVLADVGGSINDAEFRLVEPDENELRAPCPE